MRTHSTRRAVARVRIRAALAAALMLGLGGAAAGCSDRGSGKNEANPSHGPSASGKAEDARKRLWKVDLGTEGAATPETPVVWTTGKTVVAMFGDGTLRGLDARTGRQRWSLRSPGGTSQICANSARTNAAGVGVVAYATGSEQEADGKCERLAAVDTEHGRRLWSRKLPDELDMYSGPLLAAGDHAVGAVLQCGDARRFAVRSGKPLRAVQRRDTACDDMASVAGDRIVTYNEAHEPDRGQLAAYEVDSGKRLWKHRELLLRDHPDIMNAVMDDPVTVGLSSSLPGDGPGLRSYDSHGKPLHEFGESDQFFRVPSVGGRQGRSLVGQFPRQGFGRPSGVGCSTEVPVYAFDPRSGKKLWSVTERHFAPVGISGDRLIGVLPRQLQSRQKPGQLPGHRLLSVDMKSGRRSDIGAIPSIVDDEDQKDLSVAGGGIDRKRMYLVQNAGSDDESYITAYKLPR